MTCVFALSLSTNRVLLLHYFGLLCLDVHNFVGLDLKGLVDAAENYHGVLAENQKLFNEVQELKGNSCAVYCWSTRCDCN